MKKNSQTTFKDASISESNRRHILDILKKEGFTEEQLNKMPFEKVWQLYLDSLGEFFSRELSPVYDFLEKNPHAATVLSPLIKELLRIAEDLEKSVEESIDKKEGKEKRE